jgi:hypothetical protein
VEGTQTRLGLRQEGQEVARVDAKRRSESTESSQSQVHLRRLDLLPVTRVESRPLGRALERERGRVPKTTSVLRNATTQRFVARS